MWECLHVHPESELFLSVSETTSTWLERLVLGTMWNFLRKEIDLEDLLGCSQRHAEVDHEAGQTKAYIPLIRSLRGVTTRKTEKRSREQRFVALTRKSSRTHEGGT